jgi:hypothetical protein
MTFMSLQCILITFSPSITFSHLPFLEKCQQLSLLYFHTCIRSALTIFALQASPTTLPFHLIVTPGQDLFYLPILHFLRWTLILQGSFALVFHTYIYHTLIRLAPSTYLIFPLSPCSPIIH